MFEPKDTKPQWQIVFDAVCNEPYGAILSWAKLRDMTGLDLQNNYRVLIYEANKRLLQEHKKCLISYRGVGYKIATAQEQIAQAKRRPKRARNQYKNMVRELQHLQDKQLSVSEKEGLQHYLNKATAALTYLNKRTFQSAQTVEKAQKQQANTQKELTQMQAMLNQMAERLGVEIGMQ